MILQAPESCGGVSWRGQNFTITKKGLVKVPNEAVAELLPFGFTVAAPEVSDDPEAIKAFLDAQALAGLVQAQADEKKAFDDAQAAGEAAVLKTAQVAEFGVGGNPIPIVPEPTPIFPEPSPEA